jgi:hypothetical protein
VRGSLGDEDDDEYENDPELRNLGLTKFSARKSRPLHPIGAVSNASLSSLRLAGLRSGLARSYLYSWRLKPIVARGGNVNVREWERPCQAIGSAWAPP